MSDHQSTDAPVFLSVILPAYNEEIRLARTMPIILDYLQKQEYSWEIIVVDDGSRDRTSEIATSFGEDRVRVLLNKPNQGKGYSIKRGMLEARGQWRLFTDADLSTPMDELSKFWNYTRQEYDVVIGSRALPESNLEVRQSKSRELAGRVFNSIVQIFFLQGLTDTQCGFKLFSARAAEYVFPRQQLHGFAFDVEILMLARRAGYNIKEAPVKWINDPSSKVSTWSGIKGFIDLARLRINPPN